MLKIGNLQFNSFSLIKLDKFNMNHRYFINKMSRDNTINDNLWDLKNSFKNKDCTHFLIKGNSDYIGYLSLTDTYYDRYTNLSLGISKEFRSQGYGKEILTKVSDYLLNNNFVNAIELDIENDNIASIKSAEKSGFVLENKFSGNSRYIKKRG